MTPTVTMPNTTVAPTIRKYYNNSSAELNMSQLRSIRDFNVTVIVIISIFFQSTVIY